MAVIGILDALAVPVVARVRLPFTVVSGFLLVLALDAALLWLAADAVPDSITIDSFGWAFVGALAAAAATVMFQIALGVNNDDTYSLRVIERMARRSGEQVHTDKAGIVFVEIDGLAFPVLQRAIRDGHTPEMARWLAAGTHRLVEWETDLSSQTGASQAGILLGSNDDIPAFRWVEKETGRMMACSAPGDCKEIERRHTNGSGLLVDGGTSRGNLLSGGATETILTVSRIDAERRANPGYRAFFANAHNVTRASVLFLGEIVLEVWAAARQRRRDVQPRGHRGGIYPVLRAGMCVVVRDLIAFSVISDMLRGRPAVYATFSSYDEVAHHSGLERHDTLEALRKVDKLLGRIARAALHSPRPYEIVVLSDHGQTQGATFKQRNGYAFDELVRRSVESRSVQTLLGGDENDTTVGLALEEARDRGARRTKSSRKRVDEGSVVVLGSGNLALIYLMEEPRRLTLEEIELRHPRLVPALRSHPHVGFVLAHYIHTRARGARAARDAISAGRARGRRRPSPPVLSQCSAPPRARKRLRPRAGPLRQQLLRPPSRRRLRLRRADLVPRRDGRLADPPIRPLPGPSPASRRSADRSGTGPRPAQGVAPVPARDARRPSRTGAGTAPDRRRFGATMIQPSVSPHRRAQLAAVGALAVAVLLIWFALSMVANNPAGPVISFVAVFLIAFSAWLVLTRRGLVRLLVLPLGLWAVVQLSTYAYDQKYMLVVLAGLLGLFGLAARYSVRNHRAAVLTPHRHAQHVKPARRGVLIINPRSGGGKAELFNLPREARNRRIEPVMLSPGDDLCELAKQAVERGADVIGMAGGDGSQALVASVAMEHDVAHVCVPAGTRNHFALDLGLDRNNVVGALDAFTDGVERRIDLASVNERVFVNNASLGVYARVVQSDAYRDAKLGTWKRMLPEMLGPDATAIDLRFDAPHAKDWADASLVIVSNNPYQLRRLRGAGTRPRLDSGHLGIFATRIQGAAAVAKLVTLGTVGQHRRFRGALEWSSISFEVRANEPVAVGLDGEALLLRHRSSSSRCQARCACAFHGTLAAFHRRAER